MFPIFAVEGTSHMSYMTGSPPDFVKKRDLKPTIEKSHAHSLFAAEIVKFIDAIHSGSTYSEDTGDVLSGLVEGFVMEGSY